MRPPGEIRHAVLDVSARLCAARAGHPVAGVVWREVAAQLVPRGIAVRAVRETWKNLVRAGELRRVAPVRVPGVSRALQACAPATTRVEACAPDVGAVVRSWVGGSVG